MFFSFNCNWIWLPAHRQLGKLHGINRPPAEPGDEADAEVEVSVGDTDGCAGYPGSSTEVPAGPSACDDDHKSWDPVSDLPGLCWTRGVRGQVGCSGSTGPVDSVFMNLHENCNFLWKTIKIPKDTCYAAANGWTYRGLQNVAGISLS